MGVTREESGRIGSHEAIEGLIRHPEDIGLHPIDVRVKED